ncbi:serine hydrolase [Postechiella marina]|uniref:Serine hydrolase n=1 Tax=Postechiella marina TaxID=943941 RepID=A0ABP8CHS8_9FLAO
MKKAFYFVFLTISVLCCSSNNSDVTTPGTDNTAIYFPPINSNTWKTESLANLGWNTNKLQPLLNYLETKNTKSFVVLYNGKMVIENYMNNHDANSIWYWASAGKTLTTTLTGIAQEQNLLHINDKVSNYLGNGWTNSALEKENLITCKHLLSMSSGLDDALGNDVSANNLKYKADAGTRWAYHNVYKKMQDVIVEASNTTWTNYFNSKLKNKIGMTGAWVPAGHFNIYWSNTRSMARFALMIYANGKWENNQIVSENFINEATNTSQNINQAYGYLWWLNGKSSYHLPNSQLQFDGKLIPNAPNDLFAALGKNDQKIYIVPSKKLVIIRMGNAADTDNFALSSFDNELWGKINDLIE